MGANGREFEAGLSRKQARALPLLVAAANREAGCAAANVGRSTLTRWLAEVPFREALRAAEDLAYREALRDVQRASGEAVEVLRALLASEVESIRLRAAVEILAHGMKARDAVEIEERLAVLEEGQRAGGPAA